MYRGVIATLAYACGGYLVCHAACHVGATCLLRVNFGVHLNIIFDYGIACVACTATRFNSVVV